MKKLALTIIFALMATQLAFCDTGSFRIGATIPRIIGVNYFPDQAAGKSFNTQEVTKQIVMRDGQKMMLQTRLEK